MAKREYEVVVQSKVIKTYTLVIEASSAESAENLAIELVNDKKAVLDNKETYIQAAQIWSSERGYEKQLRLW